MVRFGLEIKRGLDVEPVCVCGPAGAGEGAFNVVTDKEVAIARANYGPGFDRIGGIEVYLRADEAVELRIAAITTAVSPCAGFGIKEVVSVGQPEEVVIKR